VIIVIPGRRQNGASRKDEESPVTKKPAVISDGRLFSGRRKASGRYATPRLRMLTDGRGANVP
jgi:hypothetical protein